MFDVKLDDVVIGERVRADLGDIDGLADSMQSIGLLHPIVVNSKLELIAGSRRIAAARKLGWTKIKANKMEIEHIVLGERDENEMRKDFTWTEKLRLTDMIRKELGDRRKEDYGNQHSGSKAAKSRYVHNCAHSTDTHNKTRHIAAKRAGLGSHGTYERVRDVVEFGSAELVRKMDTGELTVNQAWERAKLNKPKKDQKPAKPPRPESLPKNGRAEVFNRAVNRPQLRVLSSEETGKPIGAEALEQDPDSPPGVTKGLAHVSKHGMVQIMSIDEKRKMDFRAVLYELTGAMKTLASKECPTAAEFAELLTEKEQATFSRQWSEYVRKIKLIVETIALLDRERAA